MEPLIDPTAGKTRSAIHGALFRFAGATPEANLYDGFENHYPDGDMILLKVNYRSTREIVERCKMLISHNYGKSAPYDIKYLKDAQSRDGAPDGEPITFEMFDSPM